MLKEHNELLSRVGKGTPMGEFMRHFWVPAMQGFRLDADGRPERLRLLGEDLVAFRASDGRVGVLDEGCPHRGVSLALARNADCALQCIFHGWKIDVTGKLVDVPAEPPDRREKFMSMVKINHHPAHEAAGIVFVWLGEGDPPPFPKLPWADLPNGHVQTKVGVMRANWLNGLEGQLDSAHIGILHKDWITPEDDAEKFGTDALDFAGFDLAPRFEFEDQPYGYREAAVRSMPDGKRYIRVREYQMPWYSYIPLLGGRDARQLVTISVPVDDENSIQWDVRYNLERRLDEDAIPRVDFPDYRDVRGAMGGIETRFGQDRSGERAESWSGFADIRLEDYAVAMGQGAIADREHEQLSASDASILYARRMLRRAVEANGNGAANAPAGPEFDTSIDWGAIRAFVDMIPPDTDWRTIPR